MDSAALGLRWGSLRLVNGLQVQSRSHARFAHVNGPSPLMSSPNLWPAYAEGLMPAGLMAGGEGGGDGEGGEGPSP